MPTSSPTPNAGPAFLEELRDLFGMRFSYWDGHSGTLLEAGDHAVTEEGLATAVRSVASCRQAELRRCRGGALAMMLPVPIDRRRTQVAVGIFSAEGELAQVRTDAGRLIDVHPAERTWGPKAPGWHADQLSCMARALSDKLRAEAKVRDLQDEVHITRTLAASYDGACLITSMAEQLRLSNNEAELARVALERLQAAVQAETLVAFLAANDRQTPCGSTRTESPQIVVVGLEHWPEQALQAMLQLIATKVSWKPWECELPLRLTPDAPVVHQLLAVPILDSSLDTSQLESVGPVGWVAAVNHREQVPFGPVGTRLLNSVASLVAIHRSNRVLYRDRSEFVTSVVRALVSAIDAKDAYTSGHSERVARFAVRIALELKCSPKLVRTIYLSGLLHDVGKIGISDSVLRKTGRLTPAEAEHVRQHPELGCKILADLTHLVDTLPAVRHHHEEWNGQGYPDGLAGPEIPRTARIVAVADAFDAMTSDRPYRDGLSSAQAEDILREGAGLQWDPEVVSAFLAAAGDIRAIAKAHRVRPVRGELSNAR